MKKILIASAISLFVCTSAHSAPFLFDPDGGVGSLGTYTIDEFSGEIRGEATVNQFLGDDGVLNDGDRFTEEFILDIVKLNLNGNTKYIVPGGGVPIEYRLVGNATGIGGYIDDFVGSGTDTGYDSFNNIFDAKYTARFDIGTVDFLYNPTPNNVGDDVQIARFKVIGGTADTFGDGKTLTSAVEINFEAVEITSGWFFNLDGTDWASLPPDQRVIAVADNSVNLTGFFGTQGTDGGEDFLTFVADDNGTDIEFNAVPEPTAMVLFGAGLIGLAGIGRKRRNSITS